MISSGNNRNIGFFSGPNSSECPLLKPEGKYIPSFKRGKRAFSLENDTSPKKVGSVSGYDKRSFDHEIEEGKEHIMRWNQNKSESYANSAVDTKLDPVCMDSVMTKESMSTDQLMAVSFPPGFSLVSANIEVPGTAASFMPSKPNSPAHRESINKDYAVLVDLQQKSECINNQVASKTISRHGRYTQRWAVDQHSNSLVRLVVGCVPILKDGRIMMISANKKAQWILPKGGWELDESIEECAIRETFEEAGVTGVLGPKLSEVIHETRKAKERRFSVEGKLQSGKSGNNAESMDKFSSGWSNVLQLREDDQTWTARFLDLNETEGNVRSNDSDTGISENKSSTDANTNSSPAYTHVRLALFPLYVTNVKESWPEKRRLRKALTIDEAIATLELEKRPEMSAIITELKHKGLNCVSS